MSSLRYGRSVGIKAGGCQRQETAFSSAQGVAPLGVHCRGDLRPWLMGTVGKGFCG